MIFQDDIAGGGGGMGLKGTERGGTSGSGRSSGGSVVVGGKKDRMKYCQYF